MGEYTLLNVIYLALFIGGMWVIAIFLGRPFDSGEAFITAVVMLLTSILFTYAVVRAWQMGLIKSHPKYTV